MNNKYAEYDCENRTEYLWYLSDEYELPVEVVISLADILGPNEDFDGLLATLADWKFVNQ